MLQKLGPISFGIGEPLVGRYYAAVRLSCKPVRAKRLDDPLKIPLVANRRFQYGIVAAGSHHDSNDLGCRCRASFELRGGSHARLHARGTDDFAILSPRVEVRRPRTGNVGYRNASRPPTGYRHARKRRPLTISILRRSQIPNFTRFTRLDFLVAGFIAPATGNSSHGI